VTSGRRARRARQGAIGAESRGGRGSVIVVTSWLADGEIVGTRKRDGAIVGAVTIRVESVLKAVLTGLDFANSFKQARLFVFELNSFGRGRRAAKSVSFMSALSGLTR